MRTCEYVHDPFSWLFRSAVMRKAHIHSSSEFKQPFGICSKIWKVYTSDSHYVSKTGDPLRDDKQRKFTSFCLNNIIFKDAAVLFSHCLLSTILKVFKSHSKTWLITLKYFFKYFNCENHSLRNPCSLNKVEF